MKLNRRKAMGTFLGSALAGPSVVKQAEKEFVNKLPMSTSTPADCNEIKSTMLNPLDHLNKLAAHKQELLDRINGIFPEWVENSNIDESSNADLSCMKSLSDNAKEFIIRTRTIQKRKENLVMEAKIELLRLFGIKIP